MNSCCYLYLSQNQISVAFNKNAALWIWKTTSYKGGLLHNNAFQRLIIKPIEPNEPDDSDDEFSPDCVDIDKYPCLVNLCERLRNQISEENEKVKINGVYYVEIPVATLKEFVENSGFSPEFKNKLFENFSALNERSNQAPSLRPGFSLYGRS